MENQEKVKTPNLVEGLREEVDRCRELLKAYEAVGKPGALAAAIIKAEIKAAEMYIEQMDVDANAF